MIELFITMFGVTFFILCIVFLLCIIFGLVIGCLCSITDSTPSELTIAKFIKAKFFS